MSQGNGSAKKQMIAIQEAKDICCDIVRAQDFAFISKIQLALIVRNLVIDFHKKKDELQKLDAILAENNIPNPLKPVTEPEGEKS